MAGEISAVQTAKAEKVYSQDGMLYSGMTVRDAGKHAENMKVFDYADIDKDGVISDEEFNRYNGPVLLENTADGQTKAYPKGYTGIFPKVSPEEVEYYPGLNIEQVNHRGRVTFTKIDKNHDGVLSMEEIQEGVLAKDDVDSTKQGLKHVAKASEISMFSLRSGAVLLMGGVLSAVAALISGIGTFSPIANYIFWGGVSGSAIGAALAIGAGIFAWYSRNKNAQSNVEHNENLAKQLEEKYKNDEYGKQLLDKEIKPHVAQQQYVTI